MESALASVEESAGGDEAGGHAVDYDTLPNAIVPVMSELFKAPLSKEEEYYALEVCMCACVHVDGRCVRAWLVPCVKYCR